MTAERIALISDCEGNVAALQAALRAIKRHAPDSIVVAGDILASPFSPDPPSETVAQLRSEPVQAIPGNTDRYLLDWGHAPLAGYAGDATAPLGSGRQLAGRHGRRPGAHRTSRSRLVAACTRPILAY